MPTFCLCFAYLVPMFPRYREGGHGAPGRLPGVSIFAADRSLPTLCLRSAYPPGHLLCRLQPFHCSAAREAGSREVRTDQRGKRVREPILGPTGASPRRPSSTAVAYQKSPPAPREPTWPIAKELGGNKRRSQSGPWWRECYGHRNSLCIGRDRRKSGFRRWVQVVRT
jgi:hypothetical protein